MSSLMRRLMAQKFDKTKSASKPNLEEAVEQANRELGRSADTFKLIDRTVELLKGAPPAPVPTSALSTPRGSCKAINPVTGRQCALLSGHTKPHRHGSTEFHLAAVPGQRIARQELIERFASATHSSPFTGG